MNIWEELKISLKQPGIMGDTETGKALKEMINDLEKKGFNRFENIYFLMSMAYGYGVVCGKRQERARRKK